VGSSSPTPTSTSGGKDCRNVGFATKNNHGTAVAGVLVVDNVSALPGGTYTEN
jgi:hypothetical protein